MYEYNYDNTELHDKIRDLLEDKVTDIFLKLQEEYSIECGECPPMMEYELENCMDDLAESIKKALLIQMGE